MGYLLFKFRLLARRFLFKPFAGWRNLYMVLRYEFGKDDGMWVNPADYRNSKNGHSELEDKSLERRIKDLPLVKSSLRSGPGRHKG